MDIETKNYTIGKTPRETKPVSNLKSANFGSGESPRNPAEKCSELNRKSREVQAVLKKVEELKRRQNLDQVFEGLPVKGPYKFPDGETYQGQFQDGNREGFGIQIWPDGSYYQGYWLKDKFSGYGRFIHKEGDYYEGEWKEGMANGEGKLVHIDGSEYEGKWIMDEKSGKGKQVWADGSSYEGNFMNNSINGFGN